MSRHRPDPRQLELFGNRRRKWIRETALPRPEKCFLEELADLADDGGDCQFSIEGLASFLDCSERTVKRHLKNLRDRELLIVLLRGRGKGSCSTYRIRWAEIQERAEGPMECEPMLACVD